MVKYDLETRKEAALPAMHMWLGSRHNCWDHGSDPIMPLSECLSAGWFSAKLWNKGTEVIKISTCAKHGSLSYVNLS